MKIRIEITTDIEEEEVIIRCREVDASIQKIQQYILDQSSLKQKVVFYKGQEEYHLSLDEVLFFETQEDKVYAHTKDDAYTIKYRLYELEGFLPRNFVRGSKGAIINIVPIYSIHRNLTTSSLVQFKDSYKEVYVSRHYYKEFRQRLNERSYYER